MNNQDRLETIAGGKYRQETFGMWRNLLHDQEYKGNEDERAIIQVRKCWKRYRELETPYVLDPNKYDDEPAIHRMLAS